jgi:type IV pilus assembly protein PilM
VNVFLDVGWRGTSIIVTRGGDVSFLKTIAVGGEHFNEAVGKALSIPAEEAGKLRVRIMQETRTQRADDAAVVPGEIRATVADAVRPLVERISREVQLCLRYFAVTFRGHRPSSLTLVGGEAHEPSLIRIIEEENDVPCTIGDPVRGIPTRGLIGSREQRAYMPAWTVACGLALREMPWVERATPCPIRVAASGPVDGVSEPSAVSG